MDKEQREIEKKEFSMQKWMLLLSIIVAFITLFSFLGINIFHTNKNTNTIETNRHKRDLQYRHLRFEIDSLIIASKNK
jgi:hypothetical protein